MKRNFFTAALESEVTGTVGPDAVTSQSTFQPKVGTGEEKGGEPSLDDVKAKKEFGEDHDIADHDEIDTVAESQEHTLALEHLQAAAMRFCRMGAALEEIAEAAGAQLDAGQPLTPEAVSMVTTGLDAAGIGEPLEHCVALESFGFDARVATESFVETLKDRAAKVWTAAAKFARKALEMTGQKLKRFADYFRGLTSIYEKLEKEGAVLANYGGKPFQSEKYEKTLQDRIYAPASTKTPVAAVENALREYEAIKQVVDGPVTSALQGLKSTWKTEKAETVVAAMNKLLAAVRPLTQVGTESKFAHAGSRVEVNLPQSVSLENTGALESTKVEVDNGTQNFAAGIRTATQADISKLKETAAHAVRIWDASFGDSFDAFWNEDQHEWDAWLAHGERGKFEGEKGDMVRKLVVKYANLTRVVSDLIAHSVFAGAEGVYANHFQATRWVRFSIAEAKANARGEGGKKE